MLSPTPLVMFFAVLSSAALAQKKQLAIPLPITAPAGAYVLAGDGPLPDCVPEVMARLGGGGGARLVLIGGPKDALPEKQFRALGVASVETIRIRSKTQVRTAAVLQPMLAATGVWIAGEIKGLRKSAIFEQLLVAVVARGGVVGGAGAGARALAQFSPIAAKGRSVVGMNVVPRAVIDANFTDEEQLRAGLAQNPGCVGWGIQPSTALVIDGRRVAVLGKGRVTALVAGRNGWPERKERMDNCPYTQRWDELPYSTDFLSWTRSARARCGPVFPPAKPPKPKVANGTLILSGGGGVHPDTFARFIEAAGGKDSVLVCIPTADDNSEHNLSSFSARKLRGLGCTDVHVLHTRMRGKANRDRDLLAPLRKATGVWMDGGRTYRLMDAYQATKVETLMRAVLKRGGVIAGSSAGCQAQGDFLMRGSPNSNGPLSWEGYTQGFGFLQGVIIDAHFRQRKREKPFQEFLRTHPQMLGIGVDANTSLLVRGQVAEVLGEHAVTFYDFRPGTSDEGILLRAGQKFDLQARAKR